MCHSTDKKYQSFDPAPHCSGRYRYHTNLKSTNINPPQQLVRNKKKQNRKPAQSSLEKKSIFKSAKNPSQSLTGNPQKTPTDSSWWRIAGYWECLNCVSFALPLCVTDRETVYAVLWKTELPGFGLRSILAELVPGVRTGGLQGRCGRQKSENRAKGLVVLTLPIGGKKGFRSLEGGWERFRKREFVFNAEEFKSNFDYLFIFYIYF